MASEGKEAASHTPGQRSIVNDKPLECDGTLVYQRYGMQYHVADCAALGGVSLDEARRYAQLFAAAPDLLRAARKLIDNHFYRVWLHGDCIAADELEAAIARATTPDTHENGGGDE